MSKKEKSNKKFIIPIIIISSVLFICLIVGIIFLIKLISVPKTTGTAWGDEYKDFILKEKDNTKYNRSIINKDIKEVEGYFIESKTLEENIMILEGTGREPAYDKTYDYIYVVGHDENKEVKPLYITGTTVEKNETRTEIELAYLYDNETKEADWYTVSKYYLNDKLDEVRMIKLKDQIDYNEKSIKNDNDMREKFGEKYYEEEEHKKNVQAIYAELESKEIKFRGKQVELNEFGMSEYTKRIIDLTESIKKDKFKFRFDGSKRDIITSLKNSVQKYEKESANFDKVVEVVITEQNKLIDEAIKKQEEKEAEEKRKAEEEAAKKAAEEAAKGIKLDGTTLKYGTYLGEDAAEGAVVVINQDGTCTFDGKSCTYTLSSKDFSQGGPSSVHECIKIKISGNDYASCYLPATDGSGFSDGDIQFFRYAY